MTPRVAKRPDRGVLRPGHETRQGGDGGRWGGGCLRPFHRRHRSRPSSTAERVQCARRGGPPTRPGCTATDLVMFCSRHDGGRVSIVCIAAFGCLDLPDTAPFGANTGYDCGDVAGSDACLASLACDFGVVTEDLPPGVVTPPLGPNLNSAAWPFCGITTPPLAAGSGRWTGRARRRSRPGFRRSTTRSRFSPTTHGRRSRPEWPITSSRALLGNQ